MVDNISRTGLNLLGSSQFIAISKRSIMEKKICILHFPKYTAEHVITNIAVEKAGP